ncbi:hypothetical protein BJ742DRAFT_770118 [Cladochytrium replicatum]|nr:hypothetical protein BJ742DRAFT_770118 [Cladochytrium replicatum]
MDEEWDENGMDEEWDDDRPLDYAAVDNRKEAKKKFRAQLSRSKGTPTTDEDSSPTEEDPKNANTINNMSTGPEHLAGYVMMLKEQRRGKNMSQVGFWASWISGFSLCVYGLVCLQ